MNQKICMGAALWGLFLISSFAVEVKGAGDSTKTVSDGAVIPSPVDPDAVNGEFRELTGEITLEDAVRATMDRHPALAAAWYEIKAREGAARQAGALPNPRIFTEIDQFGGTGGFSGKGLMETTLGVSQEIPLGRKISKSRKVAGVEVELAGLDRAIAFLEMRKTVRMRFLRVYVLQETLRQEKKNFELLVATHDAVGKRVQAGDISPLDQNRAMVEMVTVQADVGVLERDLETARLALASCWVSLMPLFTSVKVEYQEIMDAPPEDVPAGTLERSPRFRQFETQVSREKASLELAKSNVWPDIEIGGAFRRFNESGERAWLLELNLPVPLFDRKRGGIDQARQILNKKIKEKEAGLIYLRNEVTEIANRMRAIRAGYLSGRDIILPAADRAFQAVSIAYGAGESNYLELLDAQRTLLKVQRSNLERLAEYLELKNNLDALLSEGWFPSVKSESKSK